MRLRERPRHYRCTPLQQNLRAVTCAVPGHRRCPHPPHRGHPGQRGVMACHAHSSVPGCRGHLANYRTREGGKEKMLWCCDDVVCISVCNEVWWCPYSTSFAHRTITALQQSITLVVANATSLHWAHGHPYSLSCGRQVPYVGIPHYRDARMQHSQSR